MNKPDTIDYGNNFLNNFLSFYRSAEEFILFDILI